MALNIIARQVGNDVIFSGSGTIKTGNLTKQSETYYPSAYVQGSLGEISAGNSSTPVDSFSPQSETSNLVGFADVGSPIVADSWTGDPFFVFQGLIGLPVGYTNQQQLDFLLTFTGESISSMQLLVGSYAYNWGTGGNADSINLTIEPVPSPTPTPSITPTKTPTPTPTVTPTVTSTNTPTPSITPTRTVTPTITPTNTQTPTNTPTVTPTRTVTPTITPTNTQTPTNTPTVTPTRTVTPTVTPTRTVTPTVTSTITPTPSVTTTVTPSVTPTLTPTPTSFGVLNVNVQYDYTNEIFGSFSGGSWNAQYGNVPHPINYQPERRLTVIDLSSITLGGVNGLNN
jgi:hypothetical protein